MCKRPSPRCVPPVIIEALTIPLEALVILSKSLAVLLVGGGVTAGFVTAPPSVARSGNDGSTGVTRFMDDGKAPVCTRGPG